MMGHLPNGNPVQQHSAGDLYPYVVPIYERNGRREYGLIGPGTHGRIRFDEYSLVLAYIEWLRRR